MLSHYGRDAGNPNEDLWEFDLETFEHDRRTTHAAADITPAYSRNGAFVAFTSNRTGPDRFELHVMDLARGEETRLVVVGPRRTTGILTTTR